MARGYGFWTFGWIEGERIARFNEGWRRLTAIHDTVVEALLVPLDSICLPQRDSEQILKHATDMGEWRAAIGSNINDANGNHLRRYATAIKTVILKAVRLCQKHRLQATVEVSVNDNETVSAPVAQSEFAYDAKRKMITVNGNDLHFLG